MTNYLDLFTTIVKSQAKYTINGARYNSGYLRKNLPDIFEKLPEDTPTDIYKKLVDLAENPRCTIYQAAEELKKLNSPNQKAKTTLSDLYTEIANKAQKNGNSKRANAFITCRGEINNWSSKETYTKLLETLYNESRLADYPKSALRSFNIDEITKVENSLMRVKSENGWHYRMPRIRQVNTSVDRVSVNAIADENLIKALDDLLGSGNVKGYYKTPDLADNWLSRHDPITIYLDEKATPEILDKIKKACEKYIRSAEDVLMGDKFAPGFALQKSPNKNDIEAILSQMKKIDNELEETIRKYFTDVKTGELKTSAGYMEAAKNLINLVS